VGGGRHAGRRVVVPVVGSVVFTFFWLIEEVWVARRWERVQRVSTMYGSLVSSGIIDGRGVDGTDGEKRLGEGWMLYGILGLTFPCNVLSSAGMRSIL